LSSASAKSHLDVKPVRIILKGYDQIPGAILQCYVFQHGGHAICKAAIKETGTEKEQKHRVDGLYLQVESHCGVVFLLFPAKSYPTTLYSMCTMLFRRHWPLPTVLNISLPPRYVTRSDALFHAFEIDLVCLCYASNDQPILQF